MRGIVWDEDFAEKVRDEAPMAYKESKSVFWLLIIFIT